MLKQKHISILFAAIALVVCVDLTLASTTYSTITDEKAESKKYSLKNLANYNKKLSLYSIKSGLSFRGAEILNNKKFATGVELNSMMRFDRGNTSYVMPYKLKVKVPKFKLPTPSNTF